MTLTFHTRLKGLSPEEGATLQAYAGRMSRAERKLFALSQGGKLPRASFKKEVMECFRLTARQFNSLRFELEGKIEAVRAARKRRMEELRYAISATEKAIREAEERRVRERARPEAIRRLKGRLGGKKRRLDLLKTRLARLEEEEREGRIPLCFGGRGLFLKQRHLEANGLTSHEDWLCLWRAERNNAFFLLGSGDETAGNQTAQLSLEKDGTFRLKLRLPDALGGTLGREHLYLKGLRFPYGEEKIREALYLHELAQREKRLRKEERTLPLPPALSYRFLRKPKGWYLHLSLELPDPLILTDRKRGVIGLDLNPDGMALVETDRSGNLVHRAFYPLALEGQRKGQARDSILKVAKSIVLYARAVGKPLVIEELEFSRKKQELRDRDPAYARKLARFAYGLMGTALRARARRAGVEVLGVNPAWTSLLGRAKYQKRYGLSVHEAAALVIARRGLGLQEKLPPPRRLVLLSPEGYPFCPWRPVRKRVGQEGWTLKDLKKVITSLHRPSWGGTGRGKARFRRGTAGRRRPLVLPWVGPPGPGVPSFTVGDGRPLS